MPSLAPITNRSADGKFALPADGWWQLVPVGEYPHAETGLVQVLDEPALRSIANSFRPGILIDFDHFSYDPERSSEAAGWVDEVQVRPDGLWARARWSDLGQAALVNGRYRHASPVWRPQDTQSLAPQRIRPLRLDTVGLTNQPNLRGMAPITNRGTPPAPVTQLNTIPMKSVATKLGLQADASEESVLSAVTALLDSRTSAQAELAPLKNRVSELTAEVDRMKGVQADVDLAAHAAVVTEETKPFWRAQLIANREQALPALQGLQSRATAKAPVLTNRAKPPIASGTAKAETGDVREIRNREVRAIQSARGCDFETAWDLLRSQKPELFQEPAPATA